MKFFYQLNYMLIHILFFIVVFGVFLCLFVFSVFFFCLSEVMNECLAFSELDRRSKGWGGGVKALVRLVCCVLTLRVSLHPGVRMGIRKTLNET